MEAAATSTTPSPIATGARHALQGIAKSYDAGARRKIADDFLGSVTGDASAPAPERAVAQAVRKAAAAARQDFTLTNVHRLGLETLASGINGPIGAALATLGTSAMKSAYNSADSFRLGQSFLGSIAQNVTSPEHKTFAEVAHQTAALQIQTYTAVNAQKQALATLAAGNIPAPEQSLATFAEAAMKASYNSVDSRTVGNSLLAAIAKHASQPVPGQFASTVAAVAKGPIQDYTAVNALKAGVQALVQTPPSDLSTSLAAFAGRGMKSAYNNEDARQVGRSILTEIGRGATTEAAYARAAETVAGLPLNASTGKAVVTEALDKLAAGPLSGRLEVEMVRLAIACVPKAYDSNDRATLEKHAMKTLATGGDLRVTMLWSFFQQLAAGGGPSMSSGLQRVLEIADDGRAAVPSTIGAAADPEAEKMAAMAQVLKVEKEVLSGLEGSLSGKQAHLDKWRADLQAILVKTGATAPSNPTATLDAADRAARLKTISSLCGWGALVAMVGGFATGNPLFLVGAVAAGLGNFVSGRAAAEAAAQSRGFGGKSFRTDFDRQLAESMVKSAEEDVAQTEKVVNTARAMVKDLDDKVSIHTIEEMLAPPDPNAKVSVDDTSVTIGSLRIPKKTQDGAA